MIKDFLSQHKILSCGIIFYIITYIISTKISPWQLQDISFEYIHKNLAIADKSPLFNIKFMFYGYYELIEMFSYAENTSFNFHSGLFCVLICTMFTYLNFISEKFNIISSIENTFEKVIVIYVYDNIFSYIGCLLAYYLFEPICNKVLRIYDTSNNIIKLGIVLLFALIILIPALMQIIKLLGYIQIMIGIVWITNFLNTTISNNILCTILSLIIIIFLVLITNIIIDKITIYIYESSLAHTITGIFISIILFVFIILNLNNIIF